MVSVCVCGSLGRSWFQCVCVWQLRPFMVSVCVCVWQLRPFMVSVCVCVAA